MTAERPVRVLVDALALKPELGGIATYTRAVVRELNARDDVALSVVTGRPEDLGDTKGLEVIVAPRAVENYRSRVAWRERRLPGLLREQDSAVLFAPTIELPLRRVAVPSAMVVHDLGPARMPKLYGRPRWFRYHLLLRQSLALADRVICVSETTRSELIASMGTDSDKIAVIGEATDIGPRETQPGDGDSTGPVLHVGAILPHKNFEVLLEALARPAAAKLRMVAAGPASPREIAGLESKATRLGVGERFEHRGFVGRSELEALYEESICLALPTLNEGFGLPLLEAQARGKPVVASRIPALLEVGGEAGAMWIDDPLDADAWASSLARLARDESLRAGLIAAGRDRSARYSWKQVGSDLASELIGLADGRS